MPEDDSGDSKRQKELEKLEESLTNGFVIKPTKEHKGTLD